MELVLVRHAETIENAGGICQGQHGGHLSWLGFKQSRLLAREIQRKKPSVLYCSPLRRAKQTANDILKLLPDLKIIEDHRLAERFLGSLETKPFPSGYNGLFDYEGTETMQELLLRMSDFLHDIAAIHQQDRVAVMSHGTALMALRAALSNLQIVQIGSVEMQKNASISEFIYHGIDGLKVIKENDTGHLEELNTWQNISL